MALRFLLFCLLITSIRCISFPEYYTPETSFELSDGVKTDFTSKVLLSTNQLYSVASKMIMKKLNISNDSFKVHTSHQNPITGHYHLYINEKVKNMTVSNSAASICIDNYGDMHSFSSSWINVNSNNFTKRLESISASEAVVFFADYIGLNVSVKSLSETVINIDKVQIRGANMTLDGTITATKKVYQIPNQLHLCWVLQVQTSFNWYNAFISAFDGSLIGLVDWTSSAAIPTLDHEFKTLGKRDRDSNNSGKYSFFPKAPGSKNSVFLEPKDSKASPKGWTFVTKDGLDTTAGNNAIAQENIESKKYVLNNHRPIVRNKSFVFPVNHETLNPRDNLNASITNAFFMVNLYHDIMFRFGFTPAAGNFQTNSFGEGRNGGDGDAIIVNVQDGSVTNNANFGTGPDGQPGVMRLGIFNLNSKPRDSALDSDVLIHELTHGLSNRLTGGAGNSNCLSTTISRGMGEGWSDAIAFMLKITENHSRNDDQIIGEYLTGNSQSGIRTFPYSTNMAKNPLTYSTLQNTNSREVHKIGEVWAVMLFEIFWNMVDTYGHDATLRKNMVGFKGNTATIQLIVDGMKLQPCNPNFIQARDSIVAADMALFKGQNKCLLFKGFAKRGLGINAKPNVFTNDFTLPVECKKRF